MHVRAGALLTQRERERSGYMAICCSPLLLAKPGWAARLDEKSGLQTHPLATHTPPPPLLLRVFCMLLKRQIRPHFAKK